MRSDRTLWPDGGQLLVSAERKQLFSRLLGRVKLEPGGKAHIRLAARENAGADRHNGVSQHDERAD